MKTFRVQRFHPKRPVRGGPRDEGVSSLLGLLAATGVFAVAFYEVVDTAVQIDPGTTKAREAHHDAMADAIAELLLKRGIAWYDGNEATMCIGGAEDPAALNADAVGGGTRGRFGLGAEHCGTSSAADINMLSFPKLANLYEALTTATANGKVDYEEARHSLSLDDGAFQFHVRSWPVLSDVDQILRGAPADAYLKAAYVGDYVKNENGVPQTRLVQQRSGVTDSTDYATVWVEVTNNGTTSTIFEVQFGLRLSKATVYFTGHTPLLAPGAAYNVTRKLWKTNDWQWPNEGSQPGSIRLCTVLLNAAGQVVNGGALPVSKFGLYGTDDAGGYTSVSAFPPLEISTPVTLNADLIGSDGTKDAYCVTRTNLPLGGYFYGQATATGAGWATPKYNDQNTNPVFTLNDFYAYSGELFTPSTADDASRNSNSDGHLILTSDRPARTIVLLAQNTGSGTYTGPASPSMVYPKEVRYTVSDVEGPVGKGHVDFTPITMTSGTERNLIFVNSDKPYFNGTGSSAVTATVRYATYEGDGTQEKFADWTLRVFDPAAAQVGANRALANVKSGAETYSLTARGAYDARIDNDALNKLWNRDVVNVETGPVAPFTPGLIPGAYYAQASATTEVAYLDFLVAGFGPNVFDPKYGAGGIGYAPGGDVFLDTKEVMNNDLASLLVDDKGTADTSDDVGTLANYNLLVVGSNVAHDAMTSTAISSAIQDWVQAGGTLVVFGSTEQNVQWLSLLFQSSIESANGGLYTPDENHPVLGTPNDLEYAGYKRVSTWSFASGEAEKFTHIIKEGPTDADPDHLAVSHAGSFGLGRIVLSGYEPFDLTGDQAQGCAMPLEAGRRCEAIDYMQNLLTQGYRELFLDYGPAPTDTSETSVASRIALVHHPDLDRDIEIHIKVWIFTGGAT